MFAQAVPAPVSQSMRIIGVISAAAYVREFIMSPISREILKKPLL